MTNPIRIGLVIQRYGQEICGGAEQLCRIFAEKLSQKYEIHIITTTAIDDSTWENYYLSGVTKDKKITIHRFSVDMNRIVTDERNLIQDDKHTYEQEISLLQNIGPYSSELFKYIRLHHTEYQTLIFFTYCYYQTSIASMNIKNAILLPCAHDEPCIKLKHFENLFKNTPAFIFNTYKEKQLVESIIRRKITVPHEVVGCGINLPKQSYRNKLGKLKLKTDKPYLLYIGRVIQAKGCDKLFEYFLRYNNSHSQPFQLVLIGKSGMTIPQDDHIINLGYVSEDIKNSYIMNASALIQPSVHESLSLVLLEAMSFACPVIVPEQCVVTKEHIKLSNGGWIYEDYKSFANILNEMLQDKNIIQKKGENGRLYVLKNYAWDKILAKLDKMINIFPNAEKEFSVDLTFDYLNPAFTNNNVIMSLLFLPQTTTMYHTCQWLCNRYLI